MTSSVTIEMAGIACAVTAREPALMELLIQRYQGFLSERPPHFTLSVAVDPSAVDGDPLEIRPVPVTIKRRDHLIILAGDQCAAQYDLTSRTGTMTLPLNLTPLDLLLKTVYAAYLLDENALFVHACAVGRLHGGDLFFGPSGSGKSTMAGLAAEAGGGVLADELVIIRQAGRHCTVHGTPFWDGRNASADVRGLFALSPDHQSDAVTTMTPLQALRRLLPCMGDFFQEPGQRARLFALTGSLARSTVCQELRFSTTESMRGWLDARLS
ncbi:MAG: hypothetical protein HY208_09130 [Nitrospirae bacterium]|nr:hypothetical protein [Nitrospirota bacterium]